MGAPADGLVSVHSARWGDLQGCVPADHYDVVGRMDDRGLDPRTGFDATSFYITIANDLAAGGL